MAGPIIAGDHPNIEGLFIVAVVLFFVLLAVKPEWFGLFRPMIEHLFFKK